MKRTSVFVFVAVCALSALSMAQDKDKSKPSATMSPPGEFDPKTTTQQPNTTTHAPNTTTHAPKTTTHAPNTTTHAPNTTTHAPKTTTHAPNTTTHAPNTTTHAPKTTTHAPNTTTHAPNTTTHAPNTTTSKPTTTPITPSPAPTAPTKMTVGNYTVKNKNVICLMAKMALQIRLATSKPNGTFIVQPNKTSATGSCEERKANLTLTFPEGHITFMFNKSTEDNMGYVNALYFNISYPLSAGGNGRYTAKNESVHLFTAKIGNSYSCKNESLFMGNGLYLDVTQSQMQAFNLSKSAEFGRPDRCAADQPDYSVAIAVGVVLLVLILIVVVAYLVGRRRRTDGYQSL